jgi:hypothetical protein
LNTVENTPAPLRPLRKSMAELQVFLSSLRDFGFVVHPFPAMNRWAIIISPYGTRVLLNTSGLSEKVPLYKEE